MVNLPALTSSLIVSKHQSIDKQNVLMISNLENLSVTETKTFERLFTESGTCFHFVILIEEDEFTGSLENVYQKLFSNGIPDYSLALSFENIKNSKSFIPNYIVENKIDFTMSYTSAAPIENGIVVDY